MHPHAVPVVSSQDVVEYVWFHQGMYDGYSVESNDLTRYKAAHDRLTKKMEDAGVKELWFEHDREGALDELRYWEAKRRGGFFEIPSRYCIL